ncbi:MAG: interleukin-like EMT inducer domain-containing protein, partial [Caldilineaceae bacterium]
GATLPAGVSLAVRSAGEEVGDFAQLWVNGVDVAADLPQRGYLLAAIQPRGALLDAATFDTHGDEGASAALAEWIAQWPKGTIVAGAVADEASVRLGAEAVAALATLGVEGDLREHFRWSHAFVGVVGAPRGSAVEAQDLLRPAGVWVGPAFAGERSFGAIGRIRWQGQGRIALATGAE